MPKTTLDMAWSCLVCLDHGAGPTSNRDAEKHTKASGHGTTVHLDRPWWSEREPERAS